MCENDIATSLQNWGDSRRSRHLLSTTDLLEAGKGASGCFTNEALEGADGGGGDGDDAEVFYPEKK